MMEIEVAAIYDPTYGSVLPPSGETNGWGATLETPAPTPAPEATPAPTLSTCTVSGKYKGAKTKLTGITSLQDCYEQCQANNTKNEKACTGYSFNSKKSNCFLLAR